MTDNNDMTRRNMLKAGGAAATSMFMAGCLGEDEPEPTDTTPNGTANETEGNESSGEDQAATEPDIDMADRPLRYVMASAVLQDEGLVEDRPTDPVDRIPAGYTDYGRIRESVTEKAWENGSPIFYPALMMVFKHGSGKASPFNESVETGDIDAMLYGKSNETLIKTTDDYNDLAADMAENGFTRLREQEGWEIFEGTYENDNVTSEMRTALNGDYAASIIADNGGGDSNFVPNSILPHDLDQFINTYIAFLNEDAPESMALSDVNANARQAEIMFADQFDGRSWDSVSHYTFPDGNRVYDEAADDYLPVDFQVVLEDFEHQERTRMSYLWFENGTERKTYEPQMDLLTGRVEDDNPEVTYPNGRDT